jgi:hypothetical protein
MDFSLGRSGCSFEVIDTILRKTSKCIQENDRHIARGQKQCIFTGKSFKSLSTPFVHAIGFNNAGLCYIDMDLIPGISLVHFLETATAEDYQFLENVLIDYLDQQFSSTVLDLNDDAINNVRAKVNEIRFSLEFPNKSLILDSLDDMPVDKLIVGWCHGDLTLANMIYSNKTFYLIDFLDTYIESPLLDLISIRQDTKHLWTCFITDRYNDTAISWLKKLDDTLNSRYSAYIESSWYKYLSLLNYVRMYRMYDSNSLAKELNFIHMSLQNYL